MRPNPLLAPLRPASAVAAILVLTTAIATAQVQDNSLLMIHSASGNDSTFVEYDPAGAVLNRIHSTAWVAFTSGAVTPTGELVINRGNGSGIELRAYDGTLLHSFFPAAAAGTAQDIDVFSDGTIVICAQSTGIVLYDQAGNLLETFTPPGMESPFGCRVVTGDVLWVADRRVNAPDAGRVFQLDRTGAVLSTFDVDFEPSDIVRASDGTVWLSDFSAGRVVHYSPTGTLLSSFPVQIDSTLKTLWSLAIDGSDALIVSGHYDSAVRYYSQAGTLLFEHDTNEQGSSLFMVVPRFGGLGEAFCLGDGSGLDCPCSNIGGSGEGCANSTGGGATLGAAGSSVVQADNLSFEGFGMVPSQPALLFAGVNAVAGGQGAYFGDGLRCAGGGVVRLGVKTPDATGHAMWGPGLGASGGWSPGDTRYFQLWYRDPSPMAPCGSGFNLSHGLQVSFQ